MEKARKMRSRISSSSGSTATMVDLIRAMAAEAGIVVISSRSRRPSLACPRVSSLLCVCPTSHHGSQSSSSRHPAHTQAPTGALSVVFVYLGVPGSPSCSETESPERRQSLLPTLLAPPIPPLVSHHTPPLFSLSVPRLSHPVSSGPSGHQHTTHLSAAQRSGHWPAACGPNTS